MVATIHRTTVFSLAEKMGDEKNRGCLDVVEVFPALLCFAFLAAPIVVFLDDVTRDVHPVGDDFDRA